MEKLVRYDRAAAMLHPLFDRYSAIRAGSPGRCPVCEGYGFIDHLDVNTATQAQHCPTCGYRWEYEFRDDGVIFEVRGISRLPPAEPAGTEEGDDVVVDLRDGAQGARDRHRLVLRSRKRDRAPE